jgi:hypothetical protein
MVNDADRPALVPPEPGHHAVGRPLVLHLDHHPLVGQVRQVDRLGHHPVEARALESGKPVGSHVTIRGGGRQMYRRPDPGKRTLQRSSSLPERHRTQIVVAQRQYIEDHKRRRGLGRQLPHP